MGTMATRDGSSAMKRRPYPTDSPGSTTRTRGDVRAQLHRRPQAVLERVVVGRRQPVHGDAGADHVEVGARLAQHRRAVRRVAEQARVQRLELAGQRREARQLLAKNAVSSSSAVAKWLMRPASSPSSAAPAHSSRVFSSPAPSRPMPELNLTCTRALRRRAASRNAGRPHDDLGAGRHRPRQVQAGHRAEHEHRRREAGRAELFRLAGRRHAEPRGPGLERRAGHRHRAVAVAVGLDHGAQPPAGRQVAPQPADVVTDRLEVDLRQGTFAPGQHLRAR